MLLKINSEGMRVVSEKYKQEKDAPKPFSNTCQICGDYVKSVYINNDTGKTGHKKCV